MTERLPSTTRASKFLGREKAFARLLGPPDVVTVAPMLRACATPLLKILESSADRIQFRVSKEASSSSGARSKPFERLRLT